MFEIVLNEDDLLRELQGLADYWPIAIEDLAVGEAYPRMAALSKACTVLVSEAVSARVH
jgi:hypothetical protein